jgi:hypothetical protein
MGESSPDVDGADEAVRRDVHGAVEDLIGCLPRSMARLDAVA